MSSPGDATNTADPDLDIEGTQITPEDQLNMDNAEQQSPATSDDEVSESTVEKSAICEPIVETDPPPYTPVAGYTSVSANSPPAYNPTVSGPGAWRPPQPYSLPYYPQAPGGYHPQPPQYTPYQGSYPGGTYPYQHVQGAPRAHVQGAPQAHVQGAPQAHVQGAPQAHVQGAPQAHVQGAPQAHVQGAPQAHVQGAPQAHVPGQQAHVQGAPQTHVPGQQAHVQGAPQTHVPGQQAHVPGQQAHVPGQQAHVPGQQAQYRQPMGYQPAQYPHLPGYQPAPGYIPVQPVYPTNYNPAQYTLYGRGRGLLQRSDGTAYSQPGFDPPPSGHGVGRGMPYGPAPDVGPQYISGPQQDRGPQYTSGPQQDLGPQYTSGPQQDRGPQYTPGPHIPGSEYSPRPGHTLGPEGDGRGLYEHGDPNNTQPPAVHAFDVVEDEHQTGEVGPDTGVDSSYDSAVSTEVKTVFLGELVDISETPDKAATPDKAETADNSDIPDLDETESDPSPLDEDRVILVSGISGLSKEAVEMFFESHKKTGGSDVECSDFVDEDTIQITFEEANVAAFVLERGTTFKLSSKTLTVTRPPPPPLTQQEDFSYSGTEDADIQYGENVILVHGISGLSKDTMEMFFESQKKCDGGEIMQIKIDENEDTALITYEDPSVVDKVLARGPTFTLASRTMTVERPPKPDPCSILVQDIHHSTSCDTLSMFFESQKRSGGGDISDVKYEEGTGSAVITFKDLEVAQRVLAKRDLTLENAKLDIVPAPVEGAMAFESQRQPADEEIGPNRRVVRVKGLNPKMKKETVELFFESPKYGGGDLESAHVDSELGTAVFTYQDKEDAQRMIKKGELTIQGTTVTILPDTTPNREQRKPRAIASSGQGFTPPAKVPTAEELTGVHTIQILNMPQISDKHLELTLEKESHGKVLKIDIDVDNSTAYVRMRRHQDVLRLLKRNTINLDGTVCYLIPLDTVAHDKSTGSRAIMVSGLNADISDEYLDMYFSNRRKSGGYDIRLPIYMVANKGLAVITFYTHEAVRNVLGMQYKNALQLKGVVLDVKEMMPLPPPPLITGPTEPYKLIMIGAPSVSKDELELFLSISLDDEVEEAAATPQRVFIKRLMYGFQQRVILIEFPKMPDYHGLQLICASIPLKDRMVRLQKVGIPTMIQVKGVHGLDIEDIELYFESRKSAGAEIKGGISFHLNNHVAVVDYQSVNVVKAVVQKSGQCKIKNKSVQVEAFYPEFGVSPPDHDASLPWDTLPDPFIFQVRDPYIVTFVCQQPEARDLFADVGRKNSFSINFEKSKALDTPGLFINCLPADKGRIAHMDRWEEICRGELEGLCDMLVVERISTVRECFQEIHKVAKPKLQNGSISSEVDEDKSMMVLVGFEPDLAPLLKELKSVICKVEDELMRTTKSIDEKVNLKHHEITMVRAHKFEDDFKTRFPKLQIKIAATHIAFTGLPDEVKSAKLHMYENITTRIKSDRWQPTKLTGKLLQKKTVRAHIIQKFQQATPKVILVWETRGTEVFLYAMSQQELNDGQKIMKESIVEKPVPLIAENIQVLTCQAWADLKQRLDKDHTDLFIIEEEPANSILTVTVTADKCDAVLEDIRNCLEDNSILTEFYNIQSPVLTLITKFYPEVISNLVKTLGQYMVDITQCESGFRVKGTRYGLPPAFQELQKLCGQVVSDVHEINRPGMSHFFHDSKGKNAIESIQTTFKAICVDPRTIAETNQIATIPVTAGSVLLAGGTNELYSTTISGGVTVKVLLGDITGHGVDAIVNAANGQLMHSGGLAHAIIKAGGKAIQDECTTYMRSRYNKDLLAGEVYTSSSGNLPCKLIVHAVGPRWQGGRANEYNELYEAVSQSLDATNQAGLCSIALPVISSGIFGFPMDAATKTICEAVLDHFKSATRSSIQEVHLMDNRPDGCKSFKKALKRQISVSGDGGATGSSPSGSKTSPAPKSVSIGSKMKNFFLGAPTPRSSVTAGATQDIIQTAEGISITLKKGSLPDEQVDVLVNSTSKNFQLGSGGVSSVLLKKAGATIQQECSSKNTGSISAGDIIETSGGAVPGVRQIFHGYCDSWDGGKHLKKFISTALATANGYGYSSIAFPAIGTGNLKYPHDQVASTFLDEVRKFSSKFPSTTLKDIRLVVFPQDTVTVQAFENHWSSVLLPPGGTRPKDRTLHKESKDNIKPKGQGKATPGTPSGYSIIHEAADVFTGKIGEVLMTVKKGDITKETCDVIVNSTSRTFDEQGAVSKAIAKAGGPKIQSECLRILTNLGPLSDVALTNAGNLSCKRILHVNATQASIDWERLLLKAFEVVEANGLKSLSIPAIGTGSLQKSHKGMAEILLKAIATFAIQDHPRSLHEINIVIFDPPVFRAFKSHIQDSFKGKESGILSKISGFVSDFTSSIWPNDDEHEKKVVYKIFAMEQATVDKVKQKLDELCNHETSSHVFESKEEQDLIAKMSAEHLTEIKVIEGIHQVDIDIQQGTKLNRIVVTGYAKFLVHAVADITKIIHRVEKEGEQEINADLFYKQVRWQFQSQQTFNDYPPEINMIIESAFLKKEKYAEWKESSGQVELYFDKMVERQNKDQQTDVRVQRKMLNDSGGSGSSSTVQLPRDWAAMSPGQTSSLVNLATTDPEYQQVAQKFTPGNIKSIQRVQNPNLYQLYALRKKQMDQVNSGVQNEKVMYHGTSADSLNNINTHGFNRSYCGKNAVAYGQGVYFAMDPMYSSRSTYAVPDKMGNRYIYQSRVLAGQHCKGSQSLKEPPHINGSSGQRYDSVSDGGGSIIVIFHDTQAYPEYLIQF